MNKQKDLLDLIAEAKAAREAGIAMALDHADAKSKNWSERAVGVFLSYVHSLKPGTELKSEDVRVWAKLHNKIDSPPNEKAWGAIALKVARLGAIRKKGYIPSSKPGAHCRPCTLWEVI
jgi:hypothetical protein